MKEQKYSGNIPPFSLETEEKILGCLITYPDTIEEVFSFLRADHFYLNEHSLLYKGIMAAYGKGQVDVISVVRELRTAKTLEDIGGVPFVSTKASDAMPVHRANIIDYATDIHGLWIKRQLIANSHEMSSLGFDMAISPTDAILKSEELISKILSTIPSKQDISLASGIEEVEEEIKKRAFLSEQGKLSGIDTGFHELNKLTGGFQRGDLIILAARPSMGKTAIALEFAKAAARTANGCLFISLEMAKKRIVERIVLSECNVNRWRFRDGRINESDKNELKRLKEKTSSWVLDINDEKQTVESIKFTLKKARRTKQINLLVIDYVQLINMSTFDPSTRKDEKLGLITKYLKRLAIDEDIPVVLLSQLNRGSEQRGKDKRPMLSDLKESGAMEEDADVVMLLYRPEYYGITEDGTGNDLKNAGEIIIAKHRNGAVDTIRYKHDGTMSNFYPYDNRHGEDKDIIENLPF